MMAEIPGLATLPSMQHEHEKPWAPLHCGEVTTVFQSASFPWWIAGGHAIEHFVGKQLRPHADIDVLVLRKDHSTLRHHLSDWDCWVADPPGRLRPWPIGNVLGHDVHDVWCRPNRAAAWSFQVMVDESEGREWRSRRCVSVTKPIQALGTADKEGTFFLVPEVQLFYKAQAPREKDTLDFEAALPLLSDEQRAWLRHAIETAYGSTNDWLTRLGLSST